MKTLLLSMGLLLGFILNAQTNFQNQFTSSDDTLIIQTTKMKGDRGFPHMFGLIHSTDTGEMEGALKSGIIFPEGINEIGVDFMTINFKPFKFYEPNREIKYQSDFNKMENLVPVLKGVKNGQDIFIIDQNRNKDFRDDTIRYFTHLDQIVNNEGIPIKYSIDTDRQSYEEISWIQVGIAQNRKMISNYQHEQTTVYIDSESFDIRIVDFQPGSFEYFDPKLILLGQSGIEKDTILMRDLLKVDDYVKLGKHYYQFDGFYAGSHTLVLVKTPDFENKVGVQVGIQAPQFSFKNLNGDTIESSKFQGGYLLIANVSGCSPSSYTEYSNLLESTKDLGIIGLEYENSSGPQSLIDVAEDENQDLYKLFRNAYSSYDCYIIDKEGLIADKFSLFEWREYLGEFIKK